MPYDFSKQETQKIYQQEVAKRMAPPLNMSRTQAEMLVAALMWSPLASTKVPFDQRARSIWFTPE